MRYRPAPAASPRGTFLHDKRLKQTRWQECSPVPSRLGTPRLGRRLLIAGLGLPVLPLAPASSVFLDDLRSGSTARKLNLRAELVLSRLLFPHSLARDLRSQHAVLPRPARFPGIA